MSWVELIGLAVALAADAFAVSAAAGVVVPEVTGRHVFRLAFHFGLFQFLMPVLGWSAGRQFASTLQSVDHWVAFGLLGFLGGRMVWESRRPAELRDGKDPTRGLTLVGLSVATSLDALAVGLSLSLLGLSIWVPAVVIGLVAAALSTLGVLLASRVGRSVRGTAEVLGGAVLIAIGLKVLVEHTLL